MLVLNFVISFLIGISVFLYGMKTMSDGLERAAGKRLRRLFGAIGDKPVLGLGAGAAVTAIVHSSTAVTVMTVGFVNAGVMPAAVAANIIMGANIGTTVTGLLVALSSLDMALYMCAPVIVGVFMMLCLKGEAAQRVGVVLAGIGLLFVGLNLMNSAVASVSDTPFFTRVFTSVNNPLLLLFMGIAVTAVIQSSTAVNALVITLSVPVGSVYGIDIVDGLYIILGTNVGTCVTALMASVGTDVYARRTSVFHLLFNVIGTVLFACVFAVVGKETLAALMPALFGSNPKFQIALFNLFQNLICALLILPFTKRLVRLTEIIIKEPSAATVNAKT